MGKPPDLDTFDRGQIVGARRMVHSVSEIVRQLGFSRSTVSLDCMVRDCSGIFRQPTRVPLLNAHHQTARLSWTREHRDWSVEDWKRVAWSNEF
ncbi:HTH_Tnp_Tc3_2 domain-containing protein [Trichonephila clavipes]|nr:HTH_Tnp_Tc3_2 domain-containing protein [Trichonephila clavipes]